MSSSSSITLRLCNIPAQAISDGSYEAQPSLVDDEQSIRRFKVMNTSGLGIQSGMQLRVLSVRVPNPYIRVSELNNVLMYDLIPPESAEESDASRRVVVLKPGDYTARYLCYWLSNRVFAGTGVRAKLLRDSTGKAYVRLYRTNSTNNNNNSAARVQIPSVARATQILSAAFPASSVNRSIWSTLGFKLYANKSIRV